MFSQDELDQVRQVWNCHRIRRTKNANVPGGRPISLYFTHASYGVPNYLVVVRNDLEQYKSMCRFIELPCEENFYNLCLSVMQEKGWVKSNDPWVSLELYLKLRDEIRTSITHYCNVNGIVL